MGDDRVRPFDTLFHRHSGPPCLLSIIKTIIRPIPFLLPKEIKWLAIAVIKVRICPHVMCRERVFPAPLVLHTKFPKLVSAILWMNLLVSPQQMRHQLNRFRSVSSIFTDIQYCRILVHYPDVPRPEGRVPLDLSWFNLYQYIPRLLSGLDIDIWIRTWSSLLEQFAEPRSFYIVLPPHRFNIRPQDIDSPVIIRI